MEAISLFLHTKILAGDEGMGSRVTSFKGKAYDLYKREELISYIKDVSEAASRDQEYDDVLDILKTHPCATILSPDDVITLMKELSVPDVLEHVIQEHFLTEKFAQRVMNEFTPAYYLQNDPKDKYARTINEKFSFRSIYDKFFREFYMVRDLTKALNTFYARYAPVKYKDNVLSNASVMGCPFFLIFS